MFEIRPKVELDFEFIPVHRNYRGERIVGAKPTSIPMRMVKWYMERILHQEVYGVTNSTHSLAYYLADIGVLKSYYENRPFEAPFTKGERWEEFERYVRNAITLGRQMNEVLQQQKASEPKEEERNKEHDAGRVEDLRRRVADELFYKHQFDGYDIAASNGWEIKGDLWERVVFFENPTGGDSIRGLFYVCFRPGSAEAVAWDHEGI